MTTETRPNVDVQPSQANNGFHRVGLDGKGDFRLPLMRREPVLMYWNQKGVREKAVPLSGYGKLPAERRELSTEQQIEPTVVEQPEESLLNPGLTNSHLG